jgi:hypothetical protein
LPRIGGGDARQDRDAGLAGAECRAQVELLQGRADDGRVGAVDEVERPVGVGDAGVLFLHQVDHPVELFVAGCGDALDDEVRGGAVLEELELVVGGGDVGLDLTDRGGDPAHPDERVLRVGDRRPVRDLFGEHRPGPPAGGAAAGLVDVAGDLGVDLVDRVGRVFLGAEDDGDPCRVEQPQALVAAAVVDVGVAGEAGVPLHR